MFYDLLEVYRKNSDGDTIALDNYSLSDGLYIKLYLDNREPEELLVDKNTICSDPLYVWFNVRDYYSRLIEMNKPVDPKENSQ